METKFVLGILGMGILTCSLIFFQQWLQNKNRFKGLGYWVMMSLLTIFGYLLSMARDFIPYSISVSLSNILLIGSNILMIVGLSGFFDLKRRMYGYFIFASLAYAIILVFTFIYPDFSGRVMTLSIYNAGMLLSVAYLFLHDIKTCSRMTINIFVIVSTLLSGLNVYRAVMSFLSIGSDSDIFTFNIHEIIFFIASGLLVMYLYINLSLLVSTRVINEVSKEESKINSIFMNAPFAAVITYEDNGTIVDANKEMFELFGYTKEQMIGKTVLDLEIYPDSDKRTEMILQMKETDSVSGIELEFQKKNKEKFKTLFSSTRLLMDDRYLLISTMKDISEQTTLREKLDYMATHDMLTGLPNRRYFHELFVSSIEKKEKFFIVIFDIDFFKNINDRYGHDTGDQVLKNVAIRAAEFFKDTGTVARFGGDEFAVLFNYEQNDYLDYLQKSKKFIENESDDNIQGIKISMGAAIFPDDADNHDDLFKKADDALFYVKRNGKDGIAFSSSLNV